MDTAKQGDVLITYDTLDIARSTCQMLELLMTATNKGTNPHFVKYDMVIQSKHLDDDFSDESGGQSSDDQAYP